MQYITLRAEIKMLQKAVVAIFIFISFLGQGQSKKCIDGTTVGNDNYRREIDNLDSNEVSETPRALGVLPPSSQRPKVKTGDIIGWYAPGPDIVPYVSKDTDGAVSMIQVTTQPELWTTVDWTEATQETGRVYAINYVVMEVKKPPSFFPLAKQVNVDVDAEIGSTIYTFSISNDRIEDVTLNITSESYFKLGINGAVILDQTPMVGSYTLHVSAADMCGTMDNAEIEIIVKEKIVEPSSTKAPKSTEQQTSNAAKTDATDVTADAKPSTPNTATEGDVGTSTVVSISNVTMNDTLYLEPMEESKSGGWKIGVGIFVALILLVVLGVIAWDRWNWYKKRYSVKPTSAKTENNGLENKADSKDRLQVPEVD